MFTDAFFTDPHAVYARLRAEAPVHRVVTPNRQTVWLRHPRDPSERAVVALPNDRLTV